MRRALSEYVVTGIQTNLAFHERLFAHPEFAAGRYDTGFLERHQDFLFSPPNLATQDEEALAVAAALAVVRMEAESAGKTAAVATESSGLSPWVAHHRAQRLR
jgi:acetyl-CoA carboxylase biotin carboxylase subunit